MFCIVGKKKKIYLFQLLPVQQQEYDTDELFIAII